MQSAHPGGNFCPVAGGNLFFEKKGAGPPLIFLHGFCLDHRMWRAQLDYFSTSNTCIAVDLRGFGNSSTPDNRSYSNHEDLHTLLDFLEIRQPVILAGLSMGARTVANFALTYPHKTAALIFADAAIDGFSFQDFDLAYIYRAGKELGIPVANRMWLDHPIFDSARKKEMVLQELAKMVMSYSGWHWIHKNPIKNLVPPAIEQLQNLTMPGLILTGQLDLPDFKAIAQVLREQIKDSVEFEIAGAGHMCNMEMPEQFNDIVCQFLNRIQNP
jgi:3-oxoadipate enol-lactonase